MYRWNTWQQLLWQDILILCVLFFTVNSLWQLHDLSILKFFLLLNSTLTFKRVFSRFRMSHVPSQTKSKDKFYKIFTMVYKLENSVGRPTYSGCLQQSHNAILNWNSKKYSIKLSYAIINSVCLGIPKQCFMGYASKRPIPPIRLNSCCTLWYTILNLSHPQLFCYPVLTVLHNLLLN